MRSRRSSRRLRPLLLALLLAAFVLGTIGFAHWWRDRPSPAAARDELASALGAFEGGAFTRARIHARRATLDDPGSGLSWAVLARIDLAREDGDVAEIELKRAIATGFDPRRAQHMLAHADLLQGDAAGALAQVAKASPRYADYAARVRAGALAMSGDAGSANQLLGRWVDDHPDDGEGWLELARIRFNVGDVGGAISAATRAVAVDPTNPAALTLRGELVRGQFGLLAALPWFEAALHRDPGNRAALVDYAATLGDAGRSVDAIAVTRRLLALDPADKDALYLEAVIAARAGDDGLAGGLLERLGATDLPGALLLGATIDYRAGRWQAAADKLHAIVERQPVNFTVRRLLAAALLRAGDARQAIFAVAPIAGRADADRYALTIAARAYEALGKADWAGQALDRASLPARGDDAPFGAGGTIDSRAGAAAIAPGNADVAIDYIRALIDARRYADALAGAQKLATASPNAPFPYLLIGDILMRAGRMADASSAYRRAAALRFDEPTMLRLVDALDRSGQRADAQRSLALYLSQNPQSLSALRLAGQWQLAAGDAQAALASFEALRSVIGNRDGVLLADLARAHLAAGEGEEARAFAAAAYRIAPLDPSIADLYGWVLHATGDERSAAPLLQKAVAIAPNAPGPREHLAAVDLALGHQVR